MRQMFDYIADHKENNQKVFFDGQIFDAFALMTDLVWQANKTIVLIDGYVDIVTLNILAKKKNVVDVKKNKIVHSPFSIRKLEGNFSCHMRKYLFPLDMCKKKCNNVCKEKCKMRIRYEKKRL